MDVQSESSEPPPCDSQPPGKVRKAFKLFGKRKPGSIFSMRGKDEANNKSPIARSKTADGLKESAATEPEKDKELGTEKEQEADLSQREDEEEETVDEPLGDEGEPQVPTAGRPSISSMTSAKSLSFLMKLRRSRRGGPDRSFRTESQPKVRQRRGLKGLFGSMRWNQQEKGASDDSETPPSPLLMTSRTSSVEIIKEDMTLTPRPAARSPDVPESGQKSPVSSMSPTGQDSSASSAPDRTAPSVATDSTGGSCEDVPPPLPTTEPPPLDPPVDRLTSLLADISSLISFDSLTGCGDLSAEVEAEWGKASSSVGTRPGMKDAVAGEKARSTTFSSRASPITKALTSFTTSFSPTTTANLSPSPIPTLTSTFKPTLSSSPLTYPASTVTPMMKPEPTMTSTPSSTPPLLTSPTAKSSPANLTKPSPQLTTKSGPSPTSLTKSSPLPTTKSGPSTAPFGITSTSAPITPSFTSTPALKSTPVVTQSSPATVSKPAPVFTSVPFSDPVSKPAPVVTPVALSKPVQIDTPASKPAPVAIQPPTALITPPGFVNKPAPVTTPTPVLKPAPVATPRSPPPVTTLSQSPALLAKASVVMTPVTSYPPPPVSSGLESSSTSPSLAASFPSALPSSAFKIPYIPVPVPGPFTGPAPLQTPSLIPAASKDLSSSTVPAASPIRVSKAPPFPTPIAVPKTSPAPCLTSMPSPVLSPVPAQVKAPQERGNDLTSPNGMDVQATWNSSAKIEDKRHVAPNETHKVTQELPAEKKTPPVKAAGLSKIPVCGGGRSGKLPLREAQHTDTEGSWDPPTPGQEEESPRPSLQHGVSKDMISSPSAVAESEAGLPPVKHSPEESRQLRQPAVYSSLQRDSKIPVKLGAQSNIPVPHGAKEPPRSKIPLSKVPVRRIGNKTTVATTASAQVRK